MCFSFLLHRAFLMCPEKQITVPQKRVEMWPWKSRSLQRIFSEDEAAWRLQQTPGITCSDQAKVPSPDPISITSRQDLGIIYDANVIAQSPSFHPHDTLCIPFWTSWLRVLCSLYIPCGEWDRYLLVSKSRQRRHFKNKIRYQNLEDWGV